MIKKIEKEIQKLESQKVSKEGKRKIIDEEIATIDTSLKELYAIKNQYKKLESNIDNFFQET